MNSASVRGVAALRKIKEVLLPLLDVRDDPSVVRGERKTYHSTAAGMLPGTR